jgi:inner membrane protein
MDALVSVLTGLAPEHWLLLGLVLLIAELATGTTYLLWPAVAAGITGVLAYVAPTGWEAEVAVFAVLVIALTAIGHPLVRNRLFSTNAPALNERAANLVGVRGAAAATFANGVGAVKINDSVWRAIASDPIEAGADVVVLAVDGVTLTVKRAG